MAIDEIRVQFERIRGGRRSDPGVSLAALGDLAGTALELLANECRSAEIRTERIPGEKQYGVMYRRGNEALFSRPLNLDLLIMDPSGFRERWATAVADMRSRAGTGSTTVPTSELDRIFYTAVMAYAAVTDVFNAGNRGGPGTLLEIVVGATVSLLTGLDERGGIALDVDGFSAPVNVTVDMTFGDAADSVPVTEAEQTLDDGYIMMDAPHDVHIAPTVVDRSPVGEVDTSPSFGDETSGMVLVIPTKLSTRERIVQAYAHQRILDEAKPGKYRTILCACNENNLMKPPGQAKRLDNVWVTDTLVPKTIVLYELYVAQLGGVYYLDPPPAYLPPPRWPHFPHVSTFGKLLSDELGNYLAPAAATRG